MRDELILGPAYTKDMSLANTGAYSSAYYSIAPDSYRVNSGYYLLECVYGTTQRASSDAITILSNADRTSYLVIIMAVVV